MGNVAVATEGDSFDVAILGAVIPNNSVAVGICGWNGVALALTEFVKEEGMDDGGGVGACAANGFAVDGAESPGAIANGAAGRMVPR